MEIDRKRVATALNGITKRIFDAARNGDEAFVRIWLDNGGPIDALMESGDPIWNVTLLMVACSNSRTMLVEFLLKRGASVNVQATVGATALHGAAATGHAGIVRRLLEAGANPTRRTEGGAMPGKTPMQLAKQANAKNVVKVLRRYLDRPASASLATDADDTVGVASPASVLRFPPHSPIGGGGPLGAQTAPARISKLKGFFREGAFNE